MNIQLIADRRNYLLARLAGTEEDLKISQMRPKMRAAAQRLHLALTVAIQELELVLGMRSSTLLDFES